MRCLLSVSVIVLSATLTGCTLATNATPTLEAVPAFSGKVFGGQQPISGARVYVLAASSNGYAATADSLLTNTGQADAVGNYVVTDGNGGFRVGGDYTCTPGQQVYVLALGGNPGIEPSIDNAAIALMAVAGSCPTTGSFATTTPAITINEVSTVAAVYALAGFMSDATHVGSPSSPQALLGLANAFRTPGNLVDLASGDVRASTSGGNSDTLYPAVIRTLANIMTTCVNSDPTKGGCAGLFSNAEVNGVTPTDTVAALHNIATHPAANVSGLFGLTLPTAPFQPQLTESPLDWTVGVRYTAPGLTPGAAFLAVDSQGAVWFPDGYPINGNYVLVKLNTLGAVVSGGGFTGGGLLYPLGIAIDSADNVWMANTAYGSTGRVSEFANDGTPLSGADGYPALDGASGIALDTNNQVWVLARNYIACNYTLSGTNWTPHCPAGGYHFASAGASNTFGIAIDASNNAWVADFDGNVLDELDAAGDILSSSAYSKSESTCAGLSQPRTVSADSAGNIWVGNYSGRNLTEFNAAGTPVRGCTNLTDQSLYSPQVIAFDGDGTMWVGNSSTNTVSHLDASGAPIPGSFVTGDPLNGNTAELIGLGYSYLTGPSGVAVDPSGNVWLMNSEANVVTELIGAAAPTVTPLNPRRIGVRP